MGENGRGLCGSDGPDGVRRVAAGVAVGIAAGVAATCALVAPRVGQAGWDEFARRRYAHRGLFDQPFSAARYPTPGTEPEDQPWHADVASFGRPVVPENSLAAFRRAVARGFGAELDVHLTADGEVVVVHDSDLARVCGRAGTVEELTSAELGGYRLLDTDEHIPTLVQVLEVFEAAGTQPGGRLPLIVEAKVADGNHAALMEATMARLDRFHVAYCIESFDPRVLVWLRERRPEVIRGQLSMDFVREPAGVESLPLAVRAALAGLLGNVATRPDFVAYRFEDRRGPLVGLCCHVLGGHEVNWTIRNRDDMDEAEREGHLVIFERFVPHESMSRRD